MTRTLKERALTEIVRKLTGENAAPDQLVSNMVRTIAALLRASPPN
jgi:hypothetical protein